MRNRIVNWFLICTLLMTLLPFGVLADEEEPVVVYSGVCGGGADFTITSDGVIHDDEIGDFLAIRQQLARMAGMVDSLQLWFDNTVEFGRINTEILQKLQAQENETSL